jgi:methionyl-tRNA formyltransferase
VHNLIRGLWPWPHAYSFINGQRHILHRSRLSTQASGEATPGTIIAASAAGGLHVACGAHSSIELLDIQLEGKRVMTARDALAAKTLVLGARFTTP